MMNLDTCTCGSGMPTEDCCGDDQLAGDEDEELDELEEGTDEDEDDEEEGDVALGSDEEEEI